MQNKKQELVEIQLYDFGSTVNENLSKYEESYILLKVNKKSLIVDNNLYPLPDYSSKCLVSISKLRKQENLGILIFDYDTLFGTRYNNLKRYKHNFFGCDERIFFEGLLIKYKSNDFKRFNWDLSKIQYEFGIKRKRLDTIIKRFYDLGIITQKFSSSEGKKIRKSIFNQGTCFNICSNKILELLPSIFADFALEQITKEFKEYLKPAL